MSTARYLSAGEYDRLSAMTRLLVQKCGGPSCASEITRVDAPRLSRYGAPHEPVFAPVDVIRDLEEFLGDPIVTRGLALMAGFTLTPIRVQAGTEHILEAGGAVTSAMASISAGIMHRLSDGELDEAERRATLVDVDTAFELLARLRAKVSPEGSR